MRKSKIVIVAVVILLVLSLGLLAGCERDIDHEEAFLKLKSDYAKSIEYDIYFVKELRSNNVDAEFTRVNSVSDLDRKNNYAKNADGSYLNHGVNIYKETKGQMQVDIMIGLSKNGRKDVGRNLKFTKQITDKKDGEGNPIYAHEYINMTATDYIKSEEFAQYKLSALLEEIGRVQRQDIVFYEKGGATNIGDLTKIKFKLTDNYYDTYFAERGKHSILKGTYVTMEMVFGRIANITVMQEEIGTESIFGRSEYESYKLEIVYLGPRLKMPNYAEKNSDKEFVWKDVNPV